MITERFEIRFRLGLQLAVAGTLVAKIRNHQCKVSLMYNNSEYDAKSILGLMCAGVRYGQEVIFVFDGEDEVKALSTVTEVLNDEGG